MERNGIGVTSTLAFNSHENIDQVYNKSTNAKRECAHQPLNVRLKAMLPVNLTAFCEASNIQNRYPIDNRNIPPKQTCLLFQRRPISSRSSNLHTWFKHRSFKDLWSGYARLTLKWLPCERVKRSARTSQQEVY